MAVGYSPKIITDGLVLCLDAGNRKSYSGSGTVWRDLARNNNGTLTNGPTFSSANGGSIVFDGNNDCSIHGQSFISLDLIDKTLQCWIRKNGSSQKGIIDKEFDNGGSSYGGWGFWTQSNGKLWWWNHGGLDLLDNGPLSIQNNIWTDVAVSWNSTTKSASFYINGALNSTRTNVGIVEKASIGADLLVGALRNQLAGYFFDGNIAIVKAYNRILTQSEIVQNYNATKGRFNL